ncbi:hypothetical protein DFH07DRAFT_766786 [Mycena maculata]|uniref:Uncharacterized protein n=1 Tax=Mycena maculata TaxID=230809 RepID=A0AAD7K1Z8_9AGAR|nr:hypothetical protein DFH07DRAFT_766786 [Mycena maculata]
MGASALVSLAIYYILISLCFFVVPTAAQRLANASYPSLATGSLVLGQLAGASFEYYDDLVLLACLQHLRVQEYKNDAPKSWGVGQISPPAEYTTNFGLLLLPFLPQLASVKLSLIANHRLGVEEDSCPCCQYDFFFNSAGKVSEFPQWDMEVEYCFDIVHPFDDDAYAVLEDVHIF